MKTAFSLQAIFALFSLSAVAFAAEDGELPQAHGIRQLVTRPDIIFNRALKVLDDLDKNSATSSLRGGNQRQLTARIQDLNRYEALWKSKRIYNYGYTYTNLGSNNQHIVYPWSVTVRNQVQATGKDGNGNQILWKSNGPQTMDELFSRIRKAFHDGVKIIEVDYNPSTGHPTSIYIVYNANTPDATYDARISNFRVE